MNTAFVTFMQMADTLYFISLGANLGDCEAMLKKAAAALEHKIGPIQKKSSIYKTKAWGNTAQPDFLNQILTISSPLSPLEMLHTILEIELSLGRKRFEKWGPRLIDIDLLYGSDLVVQSDEITLPHPEIANRLFILIPLVEVAPDFVHPIVGKTNKQLLDACTDSLTVSRL